VFVFVQAETVQPRQRGQVLEEALAGAERPLLHPGHFPFEDDVEGGRRHRSQRLRHEVVLGGAEERVEEFVGSRRLFPNVFPGEKRAFN
jgi:hypothetical protein